LGTAKEKAKMKLPEMKGYVKLDRDQQFFVQKVRSTRYDLVVALGYAEDRKVYWYALWNEPTSFLIAAQYRRLDAAI
jgi:hypothetical protein